MQGRESNPVGEQTVRARGGGTKAQRQWKGNDKERRQETQERQGGRFRLGGEIFAGLAAYQFLALPAATPRRPGNQQLNGRHYLKVTHAHPPHEPTRARHTNKTT